MLLYPLTDTNTVLALPKQLLQAWCTDWCSDSLLCLQARLEVGQNVRICAYLRRRYTGCVLLLGNWRIGCKCLSVPRQPCWLCPAQSYPLCSAVFICFQLWSKLLGSTINTNLFPGSQILHKFICQLPWGAHSRMQSASVTAEPCCTGGEREFWHAGPSWLLDRSWAQLASWSGMGSEFAVADLDWNYIVELRIMAN